MHSATTQSLPLKHIYICIKLDCYECLVTSASGVNVVADAAIIAAVGAVYMCICEDATYAVATVVL